MNKNKLNIVIGVTTGLLVGFVFGASLGSNGLSFKTNGQASGNVSLLSIHKLEKAQVSEKKASSDTLKFTMKDKKGNDWKVTINK